MTDHAPLREDIETVSDLRDFLEELDGEMPVRVNDDGQTHRAKPRRRDGRTGTFLEL